MPNHSQPLFFLTLIMSVICLFSNLISMDRSEAKVATDNKDTTNFTDQSVQQKNLFSIQSANLENIKELTSEEGVGQALQNYC